MKVTREQILAIMPNAKDKVDAFLPYINGYAEVFHIDTPKRMAHFLAQIAHESGELRYTKELGNRNYFHKYDVGKLKNMLGNLKDGDGYKYRGRGLIHITGRANYQAYQNSKYCTGDIMENPQLLELPPEATNSAVAKTNRWPQRSLDVQPLADCPETLARTLSRIELCPC